MASASRGARRGPRSSRRSRRSGWYRYEEPLEAGGAESLQARPESTGLDHRRRDAARPLLEKESVALKIVPPVAISSSTSSSACP